MSWWNKVLFMFDEFMGVLTAGMWNALLGTKDQKFHFGMPNITISAITGINLNLNARTKFFGWFLGKLFRNSNHAVDAAKREGFL